MPLFLPLAGPALLAALGWGVKKAADAHDKFEEAERIRERNASDYASAQRSTTRQKNLTAERLRELGQLKFDMYDNELRRFVEAFRQLKNAELTDWKDDTGQLAFEDADLGDLRNIDFSVVDGLKTVVVAGGAGAAAGMIGFGAVGSFAAASTGAGIAGLSGAAATNATLAWLGGGTLAAGGGGMLAGTIVLGGIVAGPLLLVTGFALDAKGKAALAEARADEAKVEAAVAQMSAVRDVMKAIGIRAKDLNDVLDRLAQLFFPMVEWLEAQIERETDYQQFSTDARERLMVATAAAITIRNIIDTPLLTSRGTLTRRSNDALDSGNDLRDRLEDVGAAA